MGPWRCCVGSDGKLLLFQRGKQSRHATVLLQQFFQTFCTSTYTDKDVNMPQARSLCPFLRPHYLAYQLFCKDWLQGPGRKLLLSSPLLHYWWHSKTSILVKSGIWCKVDSKRSQFNQNFSWQRNQFPVGVECCEVQQLGFWLFGLPLRYASIHANHSC